MAYSFDRTMGALQKKPQKASMFGGGMNLADPSGSGVVAADTSGDLSGAGGGTNTGEVTKQASDTASNAAISSNVGRQKAPANMTDIRRSIDQSGRDLQDEANAYITQNTGATALSDAEKSGLKKAIDPRLKLGDESGFAGSNGTVVGGPQVFPQDSMEYWAQQRPENVKKVDPFKSRFDLSNPTAESLGTDAGIQTMLRRSGGAEYNAGDAAFDQALLSQDQGFQQDREGILRDYKTLRKTGNEIGDKTTETAQQSANDAYAQYLDDLKKNLGGLQMEYSDKAFAREKEIEDAAAREAGTQRGMARGTLDAQIADLRTDPKNAEYANYIDPFGADPTSYYNQAFNPDQYGWQDYLGEEDASAFNNIFSLLDAKDIYGKGIQADGLSGSEIGAFDTERMRGDLISRARGSAAEQKAMADKREADRVAAAAEQDKIAQSLAAAKEQENIADTEVSAAKEFNDKRIDPEHNEYYGNPDNINISEPNRQTPFQRASNQSDRILGGFLETLGQPGSKVFKGVKNLKKFKPF